MPVLSLSVKRPCSLLLCLSQDRRSGRWSKVNWPHPEASCRPLPASGNGRPSRQRHLPGPQRGRDARASPAETDGVPCPACGSTSRTDAGSVVGPPAAPPDEVNAAVTAPEAEPENGEAEPERPWKGGYGPCRTRCGPGAAPGLRVTARGPRAGGGRAHRGALGGVPRDLHPTAASRPRPNSTATSAPSASPPDVAQRLNSRTKGQRGHRVTS